MLGIELGLQQEGNQWRGGHSIFTIGRTEHPRTGFLSGEITNGTFAGTMSIESAPIGLMPYGTPCHGEMAVNGTVIGTRDMKLVSDGIRTCGNMTDIVITLHR